MNKELLDDTTSIGIGTAIGKLQDAGLGTVEAIEVLKLVELRSISDALEGINDSLSNMDLSLNSIDSDLSKCISRTERGNLLCITGDVTTY